MLFVVSEIYLFNTVVPHRGLDFLEFFKSFSSWKFLTFTIRFIVALKYLPPCSKMLEKREEELGNWAEMWLPRHLSQSATRTDRRLAPEQYGFELRGFFCTWIFSVNILESFLEICDSLKKHHFPFSAYFVVRMQCIIYVTYKICLNQLFILSVRSPVTERFSGSQKLYGDFGLCRWSGALPPMLFKDQLSKLRLWSNFNFHLCWPWRDYTDKECLRLH